MPANVSISSGSGLRAGIAFTLDTAGYPDGDQSGANGYPGDAVTGIQGLNLTIPEPQRLTHQGDDVPFAQDSLPATELPSGSFTTGKMNLDIDALFSGTKVQTLGEWEIGGMGTSSDGQEPNVCLAFYRQALDTTPASLTFGVRVWQLYLLPLVKVVPQGTSPAQGAVDVNNYAMTPTKATKPPWGIPLTLVDNGFINNVVWRIISEYPMMLERFDGDNTIDDFIVSRTPITAAKCKAFVNGASVAVSAINTGTKTITLASVPPAAAKVVILYETSDPIP